MNSPSLAGVDLAIVLGYFAAVLGIGLWVARRTRGGEDLFLAGRKLRWGPIGLSLFASNISSTTLIGLAGAAYTTGISVANYEWLAAAILAFFAAYFVPFYIGSRISTVPEFLERRFSRKSRLYFSAMSIFTSVVVDTAGSLYAGALVLQVFFPELGLFTTCAILALVAGLYTAAGGLAAVVYTDMIQAVVLLVGSTLLTYLLFAEVDFSWAAIRAATEPGMLSLVRPLDDPYLPWLGTLIGLPVLGFYFWGTNQFIVQRVLGAHSVSDARWGCILAGFLKLPVLFIMVLPGTIARIPFPNLENGDQVFPTLVAEFLPVGVVGLVMAGLIAAIMSSIDSTLNSAAALVTLDFVAVSQRLSPEKTARIGRIVVVVFMVFSAAWAPMIGQFKGLFAYLQAMYAFLVPPVVAV
ncbi:MAG: sodium/solute symporter, partial [Myxococcota bacterium]